jgi:predicted tellurium resistance membrane protein TerC
LARFPPGTPSTDSYIQKNIVMLYVFYSDLSTTYVEEKPAMTDLIGNIGGNLIFFLGMSLLSFVEVLEIVIDLALLYVRKKMVITRKMHEEEAVIHEHNLHHRESHHHLHLHHLAKDSNAQKENADEQHSMTV